jgi:hypothetical protein
MKKPLFSRYLLAVVALIATANLLTFSPAYANPSKTQGVQEQPEYSSGELESLRAKLVGVADAVSQMAGLLPDNGGYTEKLESARKRIEQLSTSELTALRKTIEPSKIDSIGVEKARQTFADYEARQLGVAQKTSRAKKSGAFTPTSAGLPDANPFCGGRLATEVILAADVVWYVADSIREFAQNTCNQVAVFAGVGGNTRLACLASDELWIVAKAIHDGIHFCDDNITGNVGDTSYERLSHIHTDLENSVTNKAAIVSNDNTNTANIISNANTNKAAIVSNDNTNTTTITTAIANAVTTLSSNSGSTQNQVRDLILNTQIEAELARDTGTTPVASYELPASAGGQLDKVRAIVAQTITSVLAAGGIVGNAQSLLTLGDQQKAAGQFKAAYDSYRKAYQLAAR